MGVHAFIAFCICSMLFYASRSICVFHVVIIY